MTAIAWAIMFIGLIFYDGIWTDRLTELKLNNFMAGFILFCLIMLVISTFREWLR